MQPKPLTATTIDTQSAALAGAVGSIVAAAANETQLRHEIESALRASCIALAIAWTPYQLDRRLGAKSKAAKVRFVDVAHGALVIEYEPPASFKGREGAALAHARAQAEEYAAMLADEEGRAIAEYLLAAWDGASIAFGRCGPGPDSAFVWERLLPFDATAARRVLHALATEGAPLVHPRLLAQIAGPESAGGAALIPALYDALVGACASAAPSKTKLLFSEWRRLFGQAVGVQTEGLRRLLDRQGAAHARGYADNPAIYLFALHSYIALLAKLVSACALPDVAEDVRDRAVPVAQRIDAIESGRLFADAGIANMLVGDFFCWLRDDPAWPSFAGPIDELIAGLAGVNFDVSRKSAAATRDLFKGIYESCVPRALRHALGEFYTPDWLAEHALDAVGWTPDRGMLDPTCGSGTFLLDALRRRLGLGGQTDARRLLHGLNGSPSSSRPPFSPTNRAKASASSACMTAPSPAASPPSRTSMRSRPSTA